jgi:ketosteroid isomerase-like protein
MTSEVTRFLDEVSDAQQHAELAFRRGDAEPRLALWSLTEPVSWVGQFGTTVTGNVALTTHFRWVASRFSDLKEFCFELIAADVIGDAAYTVGYEHWIGTFEGAPDSAMTHRVSRVYRREGGRWRIAHGHGDVLSASPAEHVASACNCGRAHRSCPTDGVAMLPGVGNARRAEVHAVAFSTTQDDLELIGRHDNQLAVGARFH